MNIEVNDQKSKTTFTSLKEIAKCITNEILELIILPTEQCNFRCLYCYEDFSVGRMSSEVISSVKALLEKRSKSLNNLHISWFGGEPLVAKSVVLDICKYASSLTDCCSNLHYSSSMTTNAYLLNLSTATELESVGVRQYQITLDGSQEIHDRSRLRADGKGTFDTIWNNLLAIRDSDLPITINLRLHFMADTLHYLDPLIADLRQEFIHDDRFNYSFLAIRHHGGPNDSSINVLTGKQEQDAVAMLESKLYAGMASKSQNTDSDPNAICYASKTNSLLIRANGNIGKCTVALSDERNNVGKLQSDGTLKLDPSRFAPWIRGIETLDLKTLGCPLVSLPTSENVATSLKEKTLMGKS